MPADADVDLANVTDTWDLLHQQIANVGNFNDEEATLDAVLAPTPTTIIERPILEFTPADDKKPIAEGDSLIIIIAAAAGGCLVCTSFVVLGW